MDTTPSHTNQQHSPAWIEGQKVGHEGNPPEECPYPMASDEFVEWMNGYVYGMNTCVRSF